MEERPDAPDVAPPSQPPAEPAPPPRDTLAGFVVGIALGFFGTLFVAGLALGLPMLLKGIFGTFAPVFICAAEIAGFILLLLAAIRTKRKGLVQGVLTGGAAALLLCAACWGWFGAGFGRIAG